MTKVELFSKKLDCKLGLLSPVLFLFLGHASLLLSAYYLVNFQRKKEKYIKKIELSQVFKLSILIFFVIILISIISKFLLSEYAEQQQVIQLKQNFVDELKKNGFIIIVIAPIIEETIFRGFFYRALKRYFPWVASAVFSSIIFSFIHQNILAFSLLFTLSLFLTLIYELHGKLIYPIIIHSTFNVVMLIFIYLAK